MRKTMLIGPLAAIALGIAPAIAATPQDQAEATPPKAQPEAAIPFINHGGIYNWIATDDRTIYFEDNHHKWYKATLMSPSSELPFAWHIGVRNRGSDRLDRWASIIIGNQSYPLQSFVQVDGPPPRHKHTVD